MKTSPFKKQIFKCEAQGDTVYIRAVNQEKAQQRLFDLMGRIPDNLLKWSVVDRLPPGERTL